MATVLEHPERADAFTANVERTHWHDESLWFVRSKRDRAASSLPEWETLRSLASAVKEHSISRLPDYLEQFEKNAQANGIVVHWAADAAEHNEIVLKLLRDRSITRLVKAKSMLTEECHLNPFLERNGIDVVDTDLGEWIVQLRAEPPSHIVMPAIHIKREEVGDVFHEKLGTEEGATDPNYLTGQAREKLRERFLAAEAGMTGVNFAIAETGGFVVCTNEGNADLGAALPRIHIAAMGVEKLIPRLSDLSLYLRLLGRSATGQPITAYSTHFHGPRDPDAEMHIIIVDNGRSALVGSPEFRDALKCIRCGACLNTCPVYRRSGGHSYNTTVPGPIGSVLAPSRDPEQHRSLPSACSLCGSCDDVCPVKVPLHKQLYVWRHKLALKGLLASSKRIAMKAAGRVLASPFLLNNLGRVARKTLPFVPRRVLFNPMAVMVKDWGRNRDLPPMPRRSFRDSYRRRSK